MHTISSETVRRACPCEPRQRRRVVRRLLDDEGTRVAHQSQRVGTVIELFTGFVLDYVVLSGFFCAGCGRAKEGGPACEEGKHLHTSWGDASGWRLPSFGFRGRGSFIS